MPWPRVGIWGVTPSNVRVYLRRETWFDHIKVYHPVLGDCLSEVIETIKHPELIYSDRGTLLNFRHSQARGIWIAVVYTVNGATGHVKTAYPARNPYSQAVPYVKMWPISSTKIKEEW